jgi:hypothetical protein
MVLLKLARDCSHSQQLQATTLRIQASARGNPASEPWQDRIAPRQRPSPNLSFPEGHLRLEPSLQEGQFREVAGHALAAGAEAGRCHGAASSLAHPPRHLVASAARHPGRHSQPLSSLLNPFNPAEKVFESFAQNHTPGTDRLFCCYGPQQGQITIVAITLRP